MKYHLLIPIILLACYIASCSKHKQQDLFNRIESVMEAHPDSALSILNGIDKSSLNSRKDKARYALLMSMALDKNYIDTTSFDVLQPAIDYYLKNGNADERLRTYYYQGCIFLNKGDRDNAFSSFAKSLDHISGSKDSLCIARALVAQARIYIDFYALDSYTTNYLKAADIYHRKGRKDMEFDCLLNALDGAIILQDKHRADSLISICNLFEPLNDRERQIFYGYRLSYALNFGTVNDLKNLIDDQQSSSLHDTNCILNLASAYNLLGNNDKGRQMLEALRDSGLKYNIPKYQSIYISILDSIGDYKEAFSLYKDFIHRIDSIHTLRFDQKTNAIEEKHKLELKAHQKARENAKIIWGCIGGIIFLILVIIILYLLFHSNKTQKKLAFEQAKTTKLENAQLKTDKEMVLQKAKITSLENERLKSEKDKAIQQAKIAELENDRLKSEREKLELENKNLQLERDKKILEAENLTHRVETLENESTSLKELIDSQEELPSEVQQAIKVRIEMLNALMAGYITDNIQYEKPYETWIKEHTDNTAEFMNSNRLAFLVSHPRFIRYFEDHGLTVSEINYVCLYAIGLRGKEVGNYMKKRSHVNMSSAIRKKLGIDKHETNIGIYVRKLLKDL